MEIKRYNPGQIEENLTPEQEAELRRQAFERYDRLEKPAETIGNLALGFALSPVLNGLETGKPSFAPESLDSALTELLIVNNVVGSIPSKELRPSR